MAAPKKSAEIRRRGSTASIPKSVPRRDTTTETIASFLRRLGYKPKGLTPEERWKVFCAAKRCGRALALVEGEDGLPIAPSNSRNISVIAVEVPVVDGFPGVRSFNFGLLRDTGARQSILRRVGPLYRRILRQSDSLAAIRAAQAYISAEVGKLRLDSKGYPVRVKGSLKTPLRIVPGGAPGSGKRR